MNQYVAAGMGRAHIDQADLLIADREGQLIVERAGRQRVFVDLLEIELGRPHGFVEERPALAEGMCVPHQLGKFLRTALGHFLGADLR